MRRRTLLGIIVAILVAVLVVVFVVIPRVEEGLAPAPQRAWVGIEVGDSGVAEVGRVAFEAGTSFRLHAILEAKARDGSAVYLTGAEAVRIGGETFEAPAVQPYDLAGEARLLWFTVEGNVPYLALETGQGVERFRMQEFFHPEWGRTWTVAGVLDSQHDAQLAAEGSRVDRRSYGTQSYQVWIEIFSAAGGALPEARFKSAGVDALRRDPGAFATVRSRLPGRLGSTSAVFGLTQIEPPSAAPMELLEALSELAEKGLAFTRLTVLRDHLQVAGVGLGELAWRRVDLEAGPAWSADGAAAGDLLRVGARIVILARDAGRSGILDGEDLCFDYERGATMRPLREVFVGPGELEWASLGPIARDPG